MKKLLFIDHSYHIKTKSSAFFVEILEQYYDVTIVWDDSWETNLPLDTTIITSEYQVVVFWQQIPEGNIFETITHPNMVFFPMYDGVAGWEDKDWFPYRNIKIFNFSKTLHHRLLAWGYNSFHLQYFIEPKNYIEETNNKVFFWQRVSDININTVDALFKGSNVQIHMHKSIDPFQQIVEPTKEIEERYSMTSSTWFDARSDLEACMQANTFYIAPRIAEGIGMSFLEAMAMGKVIISHNEATMNEYIEHGVTGFLFYFNKPEPLSLNNIETIRKNTYEYMQKGYENWENRKHEIINFISDETMQNIPTQKKQKPSKFSIFSYKKDFEVRRFSFLGIPLYRIATNRGITRINIIGLPLLKICKNNYSYRVYLFKFIQLYKSQLKEW